MRHSVVLILVMCDFAGCVQYAPFKPGSASVTATPEYTLAFIEFGEQGSYRQPSQLKRALAVIDKTDKPLVITYVHGWHNNAGSSDVDNFAVFLHELSQSRMIEANHYHVVGIYLGWRGEVTEVPGVKYLTFFSRKTAAERLASNYDCFDTIAGVTQAARKHTEGQYTVLIGHSFGGLVVERAVARALDLISHGMTTSSSGMPADTILVLNSAADSILARQMIQQLNSPTGQSSPPFIVSLTSRKDSATGTWFKLATTSGSVTKHFDPVKIDGEHVSEREFFTTTPGHERRLINQRTEKIHQTIPHSPDWTAVDYNLAHTPAERIFATEGREPDTFDLWQFQEIEGSLKGPYWDVEVNREIIQDHYDIWNDRARAMIAAIVRTNLPFTVHVSIPEIPGAGTTSGPSRAVAPKPELHLKHDFSD